MKETSPCLLKQIETLETEAQHFGFYWESVQQLIEQIQSECLEVQEAHEKQDLVHLQEEIGDLIHAAVSLAVFCKLDPYETVKQNIEKFKRRYNAVVSLAKKDGFDTLHNQSHEKLMEYWNRAKAHHGSK